MKADTIRQHLNTTKAPLNFYASDGRIVYVDHPESVLISDHLVAIGSGADAPGLLVKEIILLAPDHIVRIGRTRRKPLRKVA
ncbi:MAG: hypothetical protein HY735_32610 [Verrucomicrobia bacterium]|nr:hypothetical protein [Verrucomicrobiota bacterium]